MRRLKAADRAWIALAAYVITYDLVASPEQTLSEGADRYMLTHPWTTRAIAAAVAAHVCNAIPAQFDPIHLLFAAARAWRQT